MATPFRNSRPYSQFVLCAHPTRRLRRGAFPLRRFAPYNFHDRFLVIDNIELHGLGSSINCLGRRVTSYTTRDAKEIAKLLAMLP